MGIADCERKICMDDGEWVPHVEKEVEVATDEKDENVKGFTGVKRKMQKKLTIQKR